MTIHEHLDPNSGAAGSTLKLGDAYRKQGHQVYYYSFDDFGVNIPPGFKDLLFPEFVAFHLLRQLEKLRIDVIDMSTGDGWLWGSFKHLQRSSQPLLVTRSHGLEHLETKEILEDVRRGNRQLSWKYRLYRGGPHLWEVATSFRTADAAFLLNRQEAEYVTLHFGLPPEQIHIVANGLPDDFLGLPFAPTPLEASSIIRIAQVGTYIPRKGIQYSTPALNRILCQYPQVHVSFLGTSCRECLSSEMVYADFDPEVCDRITVIPRYDHESLPELLAGHHIKLFPTISEAFGKALIEGMACGLAPITTSAAGPMEIVRDGYDALVVPTRESNALGVALEKLIIDRPLLHQLRQNAYTTAQGYSWKKIAAARLATYEQALNTKRHQTVPK
ncbi:glycosyltransferase family 4 protein [Acaryochloris sp. IP29b_bin.148]|uniref:glycosyltransferase family 4 protein n=1 Tax=Acaryochloris sp. IP29b_bin.148 TaxID=2969218 RepID=UPI00262D1FC4|nr:glycosyltransferase family 4 protein [Acaryochloris sp. IP29b_bin.148]